MKYRSLIMLFLVTVFFACNNAPEKTEKVPGTNATEKPEEHANEGHDEHTSPLALNNNAKWQTDESTRTHALKLNADADAFTTKANADVAAYHAFAGEMQKELEALISDCKMQGPTHEALHLWLEPVLKDVNGLKKTTTIEDGKHAVEKFTDDVKKFNQYFN